MHKFKRGDMVRRLNHAHASLSVGGIGTVKEVMAGGIRLYEDAQHYPTYLHQSDNLELYVAAAAPAINQHAPGAKLDDGKLKPDLILEDMARALTEVIKVATFGANKYTEGGWLQVPNGQVRYRRAQMRHALARAAGEECDSESNLPHLAHEAWNALARLELALREKAGK